MLLLPLTEHPRRIRRYPGLRRQRFVSRVTTRLGEIDLAAALDIPNCRVVIGEFTELGYRDTRVSECFHPLFAIELPRGTFGVAANDPAAADAEGVHVGHVDAVALEDRDVGPIHVRAPVRDAFDESLAYRTGPLVELTDEDPDFVPGALRFKRKIE